MLTRHLFDNANDVVSPTTKFKAMATQNQFKDFLRDIEPSPTTKSRASTAHTAVRKFLREHEVFKEVHLNTFLSGSYKRDTAIRPRIIDGEETRPDVDIIVVTSHELKDEPKDVLAILFRTLKENYEKIRLQARSVGIETSKADMDVVPIIAPFGMENQLFIPDRKLELWLETNPPRHTTWTTEVNQASGGRFKPCVKLMKWWRRENPTVSKHPKGFVVECIVAECMDRDEAKYAKLFVGTLEEIARRYSPTVDAGLVPNIQDPGVASNSVTNGISNAAFKGIVNKAKAHGELGRRAIHIADDDPEEALKLWRMIFGQRFPAAASKKKQGLLDAPVISGALSFPNRPVRPRTPGEFA